MPSAATGAVSSRRWGTLMQEEGIEIRLGQRVEQIVLSACPSGDGPKPSRRQADVRSSRQSPARAGCATAGARLFSTADSSSATPTSPFAWTNLYRSEFRTKKSRIWMPRLKYSMSLFVLYFGTTKKYPEIAHHTILLGEKYKRASARRYSIRKSLNMSDFSLYLHRPTDADPSMAPAGRDAWYVLCPVPNLQGDVDWKTMGPRIAI